MAKKTEKTGTAVTVDELLGRSFEAGDSDDHVAEINEWLSKWKGDATTALRASAEAIREQAVEIARLTDHATNLETSLEEASTVRYNLEEEISRLRAQINELEAGVLTKNEIIAEYEKAGVHLGS